MSVADVLIWLGNRERTGTLTITQDAVVKRIRVERGHAVRVSSTSPREDLGQFLVNFGLLSPEAVESAVLVGQGAGVRLGRVLVLGSVLEEVEVRRVIEHQIREAVLDTVRWDIGAFAFVPGEESTAPSEVSVALPLVALHKLARARAPHWAAFHLAFPRLDVRLRIDASAPFPTSEDAVRDHIVGLVRQGATVESVLQQMLMMEYDLYARMYDLVRAGVIKTVEMHAPPPSISPGEIAIDMGGEDLTLPRVRSSGSPLGGPPGTPGRAPIPAVFGGRGSAMQPAVQPSALPGSHVSQHGTSSSEYAQHRAPPATTSAHGPHAVPPTNSAQHGPPRSPPATTSQHGQASALSSQHGGQRSALAGPGPAPLLSAPSSMSALPSLGAHPPVSAPPAATTSQQGTHRSPLAAPTPPQGVARSGLGAPTPPQGVPRSAGPTPPSGVARPAGTPSHGVPRVPVQPAPRPSQPSPPPATSSFHGTPPARITSGLIPPPVPTPVPSLPPVDPGGSSPALPFRTHTPRPAVTHAHAIPLAAATGDLEPGYLGGSLRVPAWPTPPLGSIATGSLSARPQFFGTASTAGQPASSGPVVTATPDIPRTSRTPPPGAAHAVASEVPSSAIPQLRAPLEDALRLRSSPRERYILKRIDGARTVGEILQIVPMTDREVIEVLRGLAVAGLIGF